MRTRRGQPDSPFYEPMIARPLMRGIIMAVTILGGSVYLLLQWFNFGGFDDPFFVGLLFAGTALLLIGIGRVFRHLEAGAADFFDFIAPDASGDGPEKAADLVLDVFHSGKAVAAGVVYGSLLACAPWVLAVWEGEFGLRLALSVFLFLVNFVAGVGFYGLVQVTRFSWKVAPLVHIDLWNRDNLSTDFLRGTTHGTARLAAGYIGLCIGSIIFSPFPLQGLVLGYSLFAATVILFAFVVPELPLRERIAAEKRRVLQEINGALKLEFSRTFDMVRGNQSLPELDRVKDILYLRSEIRDVSTWPFGVKSANTAVTVFGMAMLPKILEVALSLIW